MELERRQCQMMPMSPTQAIPQKVKLHLILQCLKKAKYGFYAFHRFGGRNKEKECFVLHENDLKLTCIIHK